MSFTISKKVRKCGYYPDLGVQDQSEEVTVDITYEVTGIKSMYAPLGVATYSISTAGCAVTGEMDFEFLWSGSGNPIEVANIELMKLINI
ncbi:hypothetical protein [Klebsiella quasipneumoniae]|uniref:hypothetical protein n=1 Tax=Klebsiella quasipneumoniae TaxID=1463165 RepID=UPI003CEA3F58